MTAVTAVPATAAVRVDPEAAVELVGLAARALEVLLDEDAVSGNLVCHLVGALSGIAEAGTLDADQLERASWYAWCGRRVDLARAFDRLNPGFGMAVHNGRLLARYDPGGDADQRRQAAVQRRELELAMGERFARMLVPVRGGEAP